MFSQSAAEAPTMPSCSWKSLSASLYLCCFQRQKASDWIHLTYQSLPRSLHTVFTSLSTRSVMLSLYWPMRQSSSLKVALSVAS